MAIALVDTGTGTADTTTTTIDITGIDVSGSDTVLYVAVVWASASSAPTAATVTWDAAGANESFGAALTSVANPSRGMAIFRKIGPTGGTNKTISIANLNAALNECAIAVSLSGVDQGTPNDTPDLVEPGVGQTTSQSGAMTSPAGDWLLSFISGGDSTPNWVVTGTGQTIRASITNGNADCAFADDRDGANDTFTWTHDSTDISGLITFNVNAAAGGGSAVGPLLGGHLIGGGILAGRLV